MICPIFASNQLTTKEANIIKDALIKAKAFAEPQGFNYFKFVTVLDDKSVIFHVTEYGGKFAGYSGLPPHVVVDANGNVRFMPFDEFCQKTGY